MTITETIRGTGTRSLYCPGQDLDFINHLIEMVDQAQTALCISSFLIQQNAFSESVLKAARRGVQVYLLTSLREGISTPDDELSEVEREHIQDHLNFLHKAKNEILIRLSESFHAKYLLIDPKSLQAQGMLMTCNMTTDPMTGGNIELASMMQPGEIRSAFAHFVSGFWNVATHEYLNNSELSPKKNTPDSIRFGEVGIPATSSDVTTIRKNLISLIKTAEYELFLSSWSFDEHHDVSRSCMEALDRSVKIMVFTRPSDRNLSFLTCLKKAGADVFCHSRLHAKFLIADRKRGMIMTSNFTSLGLDSGFELGLELDKNDSTALYHIMDQISGIMTPFRVLEG